MWKIVHLEPVVSGCPNRCRHCYDEGGPPYGALMSFDDAKWAVGQFERVCQDTLERRPQFRLNVDTFEPSAHPDFVRLREFELSFIPKSRLRDYSNFNTNGYGLARLVDWKAAYQGLMSIGMRELGFAIHGLEKEHDWFVRRRGAYKDIVVAAQRALECGMDLVFEIHINKRNIMSFSSIVDGLEKLGSGCAKIRSGVPAYFMNDRLRALEAIRPTKTDREKIAEVLLRVPGHGDSDTEASWTRHLVEKGKSADLLTYEPEGKGPQQRRLGRLRIMPDFDVIEIFYSRPLILHGNVKRDGIERVWGNILDTELSEMPEPDTLARLYGDFASELLYPRADSVYLKHCDKYWQEHQK